jgi:hypothetical protein
MTNEYINELYEMGFSCESPVSYILKFNDEKVIFIEANSQYSSIWVKISQGQYRMIKKESEIRDLIPYIRKEIRALKIRNL